MSIDIIAPVLMVLFFTVLFLVMSTIRNRTMRTHAPGRQPSTYLREGLAIGMLLGTIAGAFIMRDNIQLGVIGGIIIGALSGLLLGQSISRRH